MERNFNMESKELNRKSKKVEMGAFLALNIMLSFMICIYAPLETFCNNKEEFWFDFYTLFPILIFMFILMFITIGIIYLCMRFLNKTLSVIGILFLFFIQISVYIQGNFFVNNLPPLDGTEINWSLYSSENLKTLCLWMFLLLLILVLKKALGIERFFSTIRIISVSLTLILAITITSVFVINKGYTKKTDALISYKNILQMSEKQNFIILLFDAVDAADVSALFESNPEYKEIFRDFTYYPDTMGAYPFTSRSVPFILSGEWFENHESFDTYAEKAYFESPFLRKLKQENFTLGMYGDSLPKDSNSIFQFDNVIECHSTVADYKEFMKLEMQLVGFRYAPFFMKKGCVVTGDDFLKIRMQKDVGYDAMNFWYSNIVFHGKNASENINIVNDTNCFKFIHLEGAHVPFIYNERVERCDEETTYEQSIRACMTIADRYLKKLKESNTYNNSIIIIMSDHGYRWDSEYSYGRQNPMLLIKGYNESHEMFESDKPVSYDYLQTAYDRLLSGASGDKVFDRVAEEDKERRFLMFEYLKENYMTEYMQTGKAQDESTMYQTGLQFNR